MSNSQVVSIPAGTVFTAPDGKNYTWDEAANGFVPAKATLVSRWTGVTKYVDPVPGTKLGYQIAQNPVTVAEYAEFVKSGHRAPAQWEDQLKRPKRPVVNVSWYDCTAYAAWLSKRDGVEYRLPTEAEWFLAAAGFEKRKYAWGDAEPTPERANYYGDGRNELCEVGCLPAGDTPGGVWDMSGGVFEWTGVAGGSGAEGK